MTNAVSHMKRLVQNMKSYGLGETPASAVSFFRRFWNPAVTPSNTSESTMYPTPIMELEEEPPFFFPMDTIPVPPMMAATCRYSLTVYDAPPRRRDPTTHTTQLIDRTG